MRGEKGSEQEKWLRREKGRTGKREEGEVEEEEERNAQQAN